MQPPARPATSPRPARLGAVLLLAVALLATTAVPALAADPARSRQWALDVIGADGVPGQGAGVTIAVVDSGVDLDHEDLVDNLVPGRDFVDDDAVPQDEYGHGTHVAGIAAAAADNGRGVAGVAPRARIMPVRVLDEDGTGTGRDVSDGIRWAVDNGADVVNLSLGQAGQQVFGSSFTEAVRYAWQQGAVVVVAAGNEFVLGSGFGDEPALVVSATTRQDGKPDYSNGVGGARWGIAAPGGGCALLTCPREDDVLSTYEGGGYAYLAGTSMAAPHVAGAAAVLLSLGLDQRATVDRLLATAEDVGPRGRDGTYGAGRLDLAAAVAGLRPTAAASPSGAGRGDTADGGGRAPTPRPTATEAPPAAPPTDAGATSPAPTDDGPETVATPPGQASAPTPAAPGATPPTAEPGAADSPTPAGGAVASGPPPEPADDVDRLPVLASLLVLAAMAGVVGVARGARRR